MAKVYELIIAGAGPAGITASVYAARQKMDFMVVSKDIGGQAAWSGDIENYTGYQFISGPELVAKFEEHMKRYNIQLKEGEAVKALRKEKDIVQLNTDRGNYSARTAIIASGKRSKELNVPGEKEFKNKGLTYCATCDGPLFSGKDVAVIGGGNSGLDAALQLVNIARKVYLIEASSELKGEVIAQDKLQANGKVVIMTQTKVKAVLGDKMINAIEIEREGRQQKLAVQGVFVEIGLIPNSDFARELEKNDKGEIKVNSQNHTNLPGIFACGDVTDVPEKQIIIAAGEGAKAALGAFRYLSRGH